MEQKRNVHEYGFKRIDISDRFTGYDDATISCLILLRDLDREQMSATEFSRLKFGCTCGGCLEGFLSPRLLDMLLNTAEVTFDWIYTYRKHLKGEEWYLENQDVIQYLPEPISQSLITHKDSRIGFYML